VEGVARLRSAEHGFPGQQSRIEKPKTGRLSLAGSRGRPVRSRHDSAAGVKWASPRLRLIPFRRIPEQAHDKAREREAEDFPRRRDQGRSSPRPACFPFFFHGGVPVAHAWSRKTTTRTVAYVLNQADTRACSERNVGLTLGVHLVLAPDSFVTDNIPLIVQWTVSAGGRLALRWDVDMGHR